MRIKRLKLTGFKSFVDPTELRIEPGLTGVVGPNGCGKSNLLEAIRWVMGESSPKSMRGGGMEDVIFAGTAARPQREFAEVSMLIDRPGTGGPEEGEVVRRIERGAGSAYRLDGRDVRAKDVALLFADAATGAHSPALVSQGKIAAVIAAKPAERRLMLEEAAGIAGLHVRRKDAEQKLRATETNLNRLDELLSDMEQRGAALRRQARAAERYRLISTQLRTAEARLIYARWRDAAAAAEAAKREAEVAEARVATTAEAQRGAAIAAADAARRLAEARAAALAARDAAADAARAHEAIVAERAALDRRIGELGRQSAALEADRAREAALAQDATTALARLAAEQEALAQRMAAAEATLPTLRPRREASEIAVRAAEQALAEAMAAEAAALGEARVAAAALVAARTRADRAQQEVRRLDQERAALGDDAALISQQAQAKEKRAAAERDADHAADAIIAAEASRDLAERERASASEALAGAEAELAALHAEQRALARPEKSPGGVRALDRVRAGPGYERALAAALGDELQAAIGEGPRAWTGASGDGDPALGDRLEPLILHVTAPPELMRRLAQIGVAERDDGQRLVVGQRLVTRDGVMRRWDGFVARDAGAEAAERLIRANRLDAIAAALPSAQEAVESARATRAQATATLDASRAAIETARRARATAEQIARTSQQEEDRAAAALDRLAARRSALDERAGQVADESATAIAEWETAEAASAALPPVDAISAEVARRRSESGQARDAAAALASEEMSLSRGLAADGSRRVTAAQEAEAWRARSAAAAARIDEVSARATALLAEAEQLAAAPAALDARAASQAAKSQELAALAGTARAAEANAEQALRAAEAAQADAGEALAQARELRAGATARRESEELRRVEMSRVAGERFECPAPVLPEKLDFDNVDVMEVATESGRLERLTAERERLGPVNLIAEQELAELDAERVKSAAERAELGEAVSRLRGSIGSLNREGRARLLAAFQEVDGHFRRLFATLFGGGEAHLALVDADDPLEAGLEIMAQPPGKRLAALTLLSGGEQALTAVALVFALFLTNPAPICVLDEVDAPLDDANVERFCDLLARMSEETETRYLIVTHNAVTMSRMDRLFGVTMVERGVSRLVSVDLGGAERLLVAAE